MRYIFPKSQVIKILVLTLILLSAMTFIVNFLKVEENIAQPTKYISPCSERVDFNRQAAAQILEVITTLRNTPHVDPRLILKLSSVASQLDKRYALSNDDLFKSSRKKEESEIVCPEKYIGNYHGYPLFQKGFDPAPDCDISEKEPTSALITILLNFIRISNDYDDIITLLKRIKSINKYFNVIAAINIETNMDPIREYLSGPSVFNVIVLQFGEKSHLVPGKIWDRLVEHVTTPYVLIGKDLSHFDAYARLERLLYVISTTDYVQVAGGSFRNSSGHWSAGCYQSEIKNYHLKYVEGYKHSAFDCMFCDYLEGPFVTDKRFLLDHRFDHFLDEEVVFHDWFLRIKDNGTLTVTCPDAMYYVHGKTATKRALGQTEAEKRSSWLALAYKWEVDRVSFPPDVSHSFTCREANLSCNAFKTVDHFMIPPCCFEQVKHALKVLHEFTAKEGLKYELEAGTALGAVKLNGYMPWDPDGDVAFEEEKYYTFVNNSEWFEERGLRLGDFKSPPEHKPKFNIWTPDIYIEMWGRSKMSSDFLPEDLRQTPTRVNMHGVWVYSQANPAMYCRNQYGPNYLKHSQWFLYITERHDKNNSQLYDTPGSWSSCPKPWHHGCQDRYPGDGNIDFIPPNV